MFDGVMRRLIDPAPQLAQRAGGHRSSSHIDARREQIGQLAPAPPTDGEGAQGEVVTPSQPADQLTGEDADPGRVRIEQGRRVDGDTQGRAHGGRRPRERRPGETAWWDGLKK